MQAIILAAGKSTRFYPFNTKHKSCISILGKTIIEHTVESIKKSGITDIIVVVNTDGEIQEILKDGKHLGVSITYVIQSQPLGAGDALLQARQHITGDFFVTWASRVEFDEFAKELQNAKKIENEGVVLIKETSHIQGVGVVLLEGNKIVDIIEKPDVKSSPSYLKVVGVYLLPKVFLETLAHIPSDHYSFEKALVDFAKQNSLLAIKTTKKTFTLKYPWDILEIKDYLVEQITSGRGKDVKIAASAVIEGEVFIGDEVTIMEHVTIKGPCYIGKKAYIGTNAILRNKTVIEDEVVIGANMEIKNSVICKQTTTHAGFIGDSVIGERCKLAAYFCTANVRLDRAEIPVEVRGEKINSHRKSLGVLMGDDSKAGVRVSVMPGKIVGRNVTIGPQTNVIHTIEDNRDYATKVLEIIKEKK
jgi:bifunctional UDP-N-acetylglucosamine pyrophosphorylase/glucosamine-1-phosphate N-acetyltransferase